ncbi:DUF4180 domain-containing protein [Deinococcus sp. MIMF12]|uniref:DUF4180 domain-containing protein n=1 Tax=Deinococcus rhizophilus TaxID=3049544 RepID=A0ABT7JGM2_9DEIO|nr:DUF4180 domain-containing protein [Deinococcus rhizophilus]MDL2344203.1 DUF4180 domain-containing protein [Deinococcus rhizophilus]
MRDELQIKAAGELGVGIRSLSDVFHLIGATWGLDGLILTEADLGPEFFELRGGLAGELFQKLTNSRLRTALVLPDFAAHGERFAELAHEHAAHPLIRFVSTEAEAWAWLTAHAAP